MQKSKSDVWVGLFVMTGFAAMVFLAMQAANLLQISWHSNTYQVSAHFDNIGGLKHRAAVRSSGVVVGRVASISYDDTVYRAQVVLDLDDRYHFSRDSALKILTSGLLGDQYVGIEAGYEDEDLRNGDTVTQTQSAMVLENLISAFMFNTASQAGRDEAPQSAPAAASGAAGSALPMEDDQAGRIP